MSKYGRRFWVSCLTSALLMYGLSYVWHGIFLNDYKIMNFPQGVFLAAAAVVYLFIGALVTRLFLFKQLDSVSRHPLLRGPVAGALCGLLMFLLVLVVGITFSRQSSTEYLLLDLVWQVLEQTLGGFAVGLSYMFVYEPLPERITVEEEEE